MTAMDESAVLVGNEVLMARTAVRKYLTKLRNNYRNERRRGLDQFAESKLAKFDDYLDLYVRLGGDMADIADPEDQPAHQPEETA